MISTQIYILIEVTAFFFSNSVLSIMYHHMLYVHAKLLGDKRLCILRLLKPFL
jgi:hypothetical protein